MAERKRHRPSSRSAQSKTAAKRPAQIESLIEYRFSDPSLLTLALTHAGAPGGNTSNERLEFLGDRVLGLVIAGVLYRRFPLESEADLARRFVAAVRAETLSQVAADIDLESSLKRAPETTVSGERGRTGILANACEALIGALYLDGGIEAAERFIVPRWQDHLDADIPPPKDAKTALQEWAQGRGLALPAYREIARSGPAHAPYFEIEATVAGEKPALGKGKSKREAEQAAAQALLLRLIPKGENP